MGKRIRIAALSAFVSVSSTSALPAFAGSVAGNGGATEVTQIMNNAELALQTIQAEITAVQQEMETYYSMLQQLPTSVSAFGVSIGDIQEKFQAAQGMYQRLNGLYGSVSNLKSNTEQRFQAFAASGLDWASYIQREKAEAANKQEQYTFLNTQELGAIDSVKKNYEAIQSYQGQIGGTSGVHGDMIVMNGQINTLLGQMNQVLEQSAIHHIAQTNEKRDETARRQRNVDNGRGFARSYNQSIYDAIQVRRK